MSATLLVAPAAEPVAVAEAKALLRVVDPAEDALIGDMIVAARQHIEAITRRVFVTQTWRIGLDRWPANRVLSLPIAPVASLVAVSLVDALGGATALPASGFALDAGRAPPRLVVPVGVSNPGAVANGIRIDLVAGYGGPASVPVPLREAVLRLAAAWYAERAPGPETALPATVAALVAPYRVLVT